jgi:L-arabinokinase
LAEGLEMTSKVNCHAGKERDLAKRNHCGVCLTSLNLGPTLEPGQLTHTSKARLSSIVYYITGHGYGHAVRSSQVIRSLQEARQDLEIHVRTTAPQWLFPETVRYSRQSLDVGIVQRDSLTMDLDATLQSCRSLLSNAPRIIAEERAFMRHQDVGLIAGDIPALGFEIAAQAGLPSAAVTNFTWTGIYRAYVQERPEFAPVIDQMAQFYAKATVALTLPYSFDMDVFPRREAIGWIARSAKLDKRAARAQFGLPHGATIVLLSFGGLGLQRLGLEKLKAMRDFLFVVTANEERRDGNIVILPDTQRLYENLLRAVDVIVTKPGYGIVADAISHRLAVLYTERGEFPEYPHLVRALNDCATAEFIPQTDLLAGQLEPSLRRLLAKKPNWPSVELNGAPIAAEKILALLGAQSS